MNRTIANLHGRPFCAILPAKEKSVLRWQAGHALRDDGFQMFHVLLVRSATDVASPVIMVVSENAADFAVQLDAPRPVALMPCLRTILVNLCQRFQFVCQPDGFRNV